MPLNLAALLDGLPGANEADYPASRAECAQAWADAMKAYATGVVPPSATVAAAAPALEAALFSAFALTSRNDLASALEAAFGTFALTVASGMAPTNTGVPPAGLVGFLGLFSQPYATTRHEGVVRVANAIDAWMRTGTATLVAPPYTVVTWS